MARPAFRAAPVRVRVPATSANLGPGFDAFGLALALYDDVLLRVADTGLRIDIAGEGAGVVRTDARHLVAKAARAAFDALGGQPRGLELVCANRIPHGRGLGSSAAAIVAGILAARAVTLGGYDRLDDEAVLALASQIEGHPDNVAACLLGGFTIAWTESKDGEKPDVDSGPQALRLEPHPDLAPVVFLPESQVATTKARKLLPDQVPHADAAANAARAALLPLALTGRVDLLLAATQDRLHQDYRAPSMGRSAALVGRLRELGLPAVLSGAGPAVLVLTTRDQVDDALASAGRWFTAMPVQPDLLGARIVEIGE